MTSLPPYRELVPDTFRILARRLPTGTVVLCQPGERGDMIVMIPPQFVQAFCQGVYDVSMERT